MDRRERINSLEEAILALLPGWQSQIRTAGPGIVESFDPVAGTVVVQHAIMAKVAFENNTSLDVPLPLLLDVPVVFPRGGGFTLTFPISKGDEVLVVLSDRCIDSWWDEGDVGVQSELRMHDLSDGFALPGPFSRPKVIPGISVASCQLRADDGGTYVEVAAGQVVNVVAPGGINLNGVTIDAAGNVDVPGNVVIDGSTSGTGDGTFDGISVATHRHGGVQVGGGISGPPL